MQTAEIQKKAKFIINSDGKPIEVILPLEIYQQLVELQTSLEIYKQKDTQESLKKAKVEIEKGDTVSFKIMDEVTEWLDN